MNRGTHARRIKLSGLVQGVGFRPFVYGLARDHGLAGWVRNEVGEVLVEVEGDATAIERFCADLVKRAPPLARPAVTSEEAAEPTGLKGFEIVASSAASAANIFVPTDHFACTDCLRELADLEDRRYRYPFINCTNCGPRYTLITGMPYDRANTTMAGFTLCAACRAEYENPQDRRFHAEPVACPECGPQLTFCRTESQESLTGDAALTAAVAALRTGKIVAAKGIGGYHLLCDARDDAAVGTLRERKHRPDKPLAVMFPTAGDDGLDRVREAVVPTEAEAHAMISDLRPIVLVRRRQRDGLSPFVAPGLNELGVFLPYSPMHQLVLDAFGAPLVATSGNLSGEPVLTENVEAQARLASIADAFLHHNRPIQRPADDSVLRTTRDRPRPLRLGRGAAPLELTLSAELARPLLAVGGQMKGAIAIAWKNRAVISPHIGEMDTPRSLKVFEATVHDLQSLYGIRAEHVVADAHAGYTTHRWAQSSGLPVTKVAHHHAHASALAGEHAIDTPMIVFTWDGTGMGTDGTLWGGETLVGQPGQWQRVASLRPFRLPGGERAGREPWRSAAALCWELGLACPAAPADAALVSDAWAKGVNSPETSAAGRLFDAAAAVLLDLPAVSHEAQGPMQLEAIAAGIGEAIELPLRADARGVERADWQPLWQHLLNDDRPVEQRAADLHTSLAHSIAEQADGLRDRHAVTRVGLTGGVFQNRRLTNEACHLLEDRGFEVLLPHSLPCNDGGLCFGQVIEAATLQGGRS